MRKMAVVVAVLALAGGARAADDKPGSTGQETKEAGQAAARDTKEGAQQAKDWSKEQGQRAERRTEETSQSMQQSGQQARENAREQQGQMAQQQERQGEQARDQMKKDDFNIEGKVAKVSKNQLSLTREGAPTATLHTDKTTKVELDGQQASISQLKPGQDVKASFNLKGDKPHAIEVKAEKMKEDDRKELQEQQQENRQRGQQ